MIRVLIDELGDGHKDIILKIDAIPTFAQIGDLYYMADFLGLDADKINMDPNNLGIEYIKYVKDKIENVNNSETFIIFDISDQYIGGLLVTRGKKELLNLIYVTTVNIHGNEINNTIVNDLIKKRKIIFDKKREWLLSKSSILDGLIWSLKKIRKTAANNRLLPAGVLALLTALS